MNPRHSFILFAITCIQSIGSYQLPEAPARLASWPAKVELTGTFYTLAPQMYSDKVSVKEMSFSGINSVLYSLLEDVMPPTWYPTTPKITINHLDASDALVLSTLIPDVSIMQEALRLMPTTKAFEKCEQPYAVTTKLDATLAAVTLCSSIESGINRCRLVKLFTPAGLILLYKANTSTIKTLRKIASWIITKGTFAFSNDKESQSSSLETTFDASCAAIKMACAQYSQNQLLKEGIACFKLLIQTSTVTIDKTVVKACLTKIANKLNLFDDANIYKTQYKALIEECL